MRLIEIRDLDGPNAFLLEPAIKVEFAIEPNDDLASAADRIGGWLRQIDDDLFEETDLLPLLAETVSVLHVAATEDEPTALALHLETLGHVAVVFGWDHRTFALHVADVLVALVSGATPDPVGTVEDLKAIRAESTHDDTPLYLRDDQRSVPIISLTGTNGKTTTTRLTSFLLQGAGYHPGWSSSNGVFVDGEQVLDGDYSGPSGARRVLEDARVDVAVLETARGGVLLRGLAYESNDISVFLNISADHLGLQGIHTVEALAQVKGVLVRVTRPEGTVILNADDPLVVQFTDQVAARVVLFSQQGDANPRVRQHVEAGGTVWIVADGDIVRLAGGAAEVLLPTADVPLTYGGKARHMVENALAATAAAHAFGLTDDQLRSGLRAFGMTPSQNPGRLNVYELNGITIVIDFAHNEAGLLHLLDLGRSMTKEGGRLIGVIGTAGDRTDDALREIARMAATDCDRVIFKETKKYLRGRASNEEMNAHYREGVAASGRNVEIDIVADELVATRKAVGEAKPGDAIVVMCVEKLAEVPAAVVELGGQPARYGN